MGLIDQYLSPIPLENKKEKKPKNGRALSQFRICLHTVRGRQK